MIDLLSLQVSIDMQHIVLDSDAIILPCHTCVVRILNASVVPRYLRESSVENMQAPSDEGASLMVNMSQST